MRIPSTLSLALVAILGSCSSDADPDRSAGGGFETSDIAARAVDTLANALPEARIWLLTDPVDSHQVAEGLDSAGVDSTGHAMFPRGRGKGARLGLEAWQGDSLVGFLRRIDMQDRDTFQIVLRRPKALRLPCAPYEGAIFVLPGSHFRQLAPRSCVDSFRILVPPGHWEIVVLGPEGTAPRWLGIQGDSLPPWPPKGMGPGPGGVNAGPSGSGAGGSIALP
ncbi:MAG: hypothetical protein H6686_10665 [Fibrobacteria bacterium]|nr:hypothetical protein [Fibrobacteria bacterium]